MSTIHQKSNRAALLLLLASLPLGAHAQQAPDATPAEKVSQAQQRQAASDAQTSAVTIALIQLLIQEGVISLDKAQAMLQAAERQAAIERDRQQPAPQESVRVPYVPQTVKNEMRKELREEIVAQAKTERWVAPDALPDWLDRISWDGDFRLRHHADFFDEGNFPYMPDLQKVIDKGGSTQPLPTMNTTVDRNRLRYRARVGLSAAVTDGIKVGFRLASGSDNGPISTNDTFGDYFSKDSVWIDRAYIQARLLPGLDFVGGRMANPFWASELVWDGDINPEGLAFKGAYDLEPVKLFGTAGVFPLKESSLHRDQWLYGAQVGGQLGVAGGSLRLGAAYYDFKNVQSRLNPADGSQLNDHTAPVLIGQGNTVFNMRTDGTTELPGLASRFELLNLSLQYEHPLSAGRVLRVGADYVNNLGMNVDEINRLLRADAEIGTDPGDTGWQFKIGGGHAKIQNKRDWDVSLAYRYVESDAVLAAFADSDFGTYGGSDLKGLILEGNYAVADRTWLSLKWLSADAIDRAPFAVDTVLIDLNARF